MKKHAICIQCHNNPEQINEIINFFDETKFDFFIHVDKKSNILPLIINKSNVFFVSDDKRIDVRWGKFSQVQATLALFELIDEVNYSYVHLISGADFPIMSGDEIYERLKDDKHEYIECMKMPEETERWSWGGLDRVMVKYPNWMIERPQFKLRRILRILYREFIMRTHIFKKKNPPFKDFYGASQWFSLTGDCIGYIKNYLTNNKEYTKFFRRSFCCDEVFFSTLIKNSPFSSKIANDNKRYIIWEGSKTQGPINLTPSHVDDMLKSDCFFARKIIDADTVLALIENIKK